jgi:hypothetical protein
MSVWAKIRGTIEAVFQLGLGGPNLNNNGGIIEAKNAALSSFAIVRGATPVGANDLATKAYVDSGGASGAVQEIRFAIGTATVSSATQIPANAQISECQVEITTPYSGGSTISVGQTGAVTLFQLTSDNLPTANGIYSVDQDTAQGAAPLEVLATIGGAPGAGAGFVIVKFSETLP